MSTYTTSVWSWWLSTSNKADETSRNILTILVPFFIIVSFVFFNKKQTKGDPPQPPGPHGLPIVGYLPFLGSNLNQCFEELASLYGPIFKLKLGAKESIVVTSPSLVKEMLRDQDITFANRGEPTIASKSFLFGNGTMDIGFSDYGFEWRKMRKVFVSEMLSNNHLDASYHLRKQQLRKMMYETNKKANQIVDVGEIAFLTIVSSILSMMWGDTMKGEEASVINTEFRAIITKIVELLGKPNVSDFFPWLARFDLQGIERRMKVYSHQIEKIFDSAIHHQNTGENKQKDFLGHLLQVNKIEDPAISLTLPQVKNILMDTMTGGTDTTTAMIEWAMAEMLQHPSILRKVQDELTEIVGLNATVEEAHLPKLKYLSAVVKETLRLHPPLPMLLPHSPSEPSTIGGYSIPKGVRVLLNVYAIHRDPQLWEDPLVFRPERFLYGSHAEKVNYLGKHFQYLPFGSGRRICPGIPLVERMSVLVLASLLHAFQWKLPSDSVEVDFAENFGIVLKKSKPLMAIPSPRLSNLELYPYQD
ncbi:Geraniol 8-hydroxylase [Bienertia sinuspersici]